MAEAAADILLEARRVSRRYGRRWALRNVSARFTAGTVSAVVGHNGAGKSTLMSLLSGLLRPTEGTLLAFGHDLHRHPAPRAMRRRMAVLAHQPFIYGELSGLENLRFFSRLYERDPSDAQLAAVLDRVGLKLAARRPARTYSRGMFQRLALGRVLVQNAEVWLLDEPTTGLDAAGRELFADVVREARGEGRCLVLVTHDPTLVEATTDRLYHLDNGRLRGAEAGP